MNIPISNYKKRREELINQMKEITNNEPSCLLLYSAPERKRSNDTYYQYRFNSNIFFLTGIKEPEIILLIRTEAPHTILFALPKEPDKEVWTGIRKSFDEFKKIYDIDEAYDIKKLDSDLPELIKGSQHLFVSFIDSEIALNKLPGIINKMKQREHGDRKIMKEIKELIRKECVTDSTKVYPNVIENIRKLKDNNTMGVSYPEHIHDAHKLIAEMRKEKNKYEIDAVKECIYITKESFINTISFTKPGMNERDVQAHLEYNFKKNGGDDVGYLSVIAGGINATILHYINNDRKLEDNTLLLIDAGAEKDGYTADITRTFPVGKKFTPAQKDVYQAVLHIQNKVIESIKPGMTMKELNDYSIRLTIESLIDLKVLKGNVEDLFILNSHNPFYMHGIGHFLGLDVHDVGSYYEDINKPKPFKPGTILTVEPGLYFGKLAEKYTPQHLYGIGVRIEDNILVTEEGYENLSKDIPKVVEDIENLK